MGMEPAGRHLLGRATSGPLRGSQLRPIPHGNHFWFAWGVFKPATRIVDVSPHG